MTPTLADQDVRDQIRTGTDKTLFVDAGAGSGKTSALIGRLLTLVLVDEVPLRAIAAVTFTEKAGAELRDRLRVELEKWRRDRNANTRARANTALDDLDAAAIGTLHSFAQRLLLEYPIEAGLPPVVEVLDEIGSSVAFDERWSALQVALLDDDAAAPPLLLALSVGVTLKQLRSLTQVLGRDWDLLAEKVLATAPPPLSAPEVTDLLEASEAVLAECDGCTDDSDRLLLKLAALRGEMAALGAASDDQQVLAALERIGGLRFTHGQKGNWDGRIEQVRAAANDLAAAARARAQEVQDLCVRHLSTWLAQQVLDAAQVRRREGRLEFHDLLVLARDLLRNDPTVREALQHRYVRVLLDEFQDTDPIQIELAARICGGAAATQADWRDIDIPAGRLFVVGDPKQSIYRFRRANIATYLSAADVIGDRVELTTNFRAVDPILGWVNDVFGEIIEPVDAAQPAYEPLSVHRTDSGSGPAIATVGTDIHTDEPNADELRRREAADMAAAARLALDDGWTVFDEHDGAWRSARPEDITILVPARTSLPYLEDALDAAGVPYRAESSSLVYQAAEVRDLLLCARAIADPTDQLALVATLRSPLFGCGDDDLWRWRHGGGRFSLHSSVADLTDTPVGEALAVLKKLSFEARWLAPSELLGAIIEQRRMLEVAATGPRARDKWRRLRFVVDQARAWSEASSGGLRAYLAWASRQGLEVGRVAEAVLPESDAEAVRVMTVHAAKGLEFPIVLLSGMTSQPRRPSGVRLLWTGSGYEVALNAAVHTDAFETAVPVDEQMDAYERRRLLYVAATRARDHLVVSLHRSTKGSKTSAHILADAGAAAAGSLPLRALPAPSPPPTPAVAPPPYADFRSELDRAQQASARSAAQSASGLEGTEPAVVLGDGDPGLAKGPRSLDLPPWSKGRYGSAVGRAVHGVLQSVDLATGAGLDDAVRAQSLAEGVADRADLVRQLASSALASDLVRRAATREHWRETYVGTIVEDDVVLEGYVDLIYRDDDDTLVIVDYKTDAVPSGAIDSRVTYYRPQLVAYRRALIAATSANVRTELLFLHPDASIAVPVDG